MFIHYLSEKRNLKLVLGFIVLGLSLVLVSTFGLAHPPSNMELEYLGEEGLLKVTVTHRVGNPSSHYIEKVSVFKNGNLEIEEDYSKQDAGKGGSYEYKLSAKNGDRIRVQAVCNRFGNLARNLEVEGVPVLGPVLLQANLNTSSQVNGVEENTPDNAMGLAIVMLDSEENVLRYSIAYKGLSGRPTMAHFHRGTKGEEGPPVRTIFGKPEIEGAPGSAPQGTSGFISGVWENEGSQPLTDDLVEAVLSGDVYINVHTELNPPGELRAQLVEVE